MLIVRVILRPFGIKSADNELLELHIANEGGPENACRYSVRAVKDDTLTPLARTHAEVLHDRRDGAAILVEKALSSLTGGVFDSRMPEARP